MKRHRIYTIMLTIVSVIILQSSIACMKIDNPPALEIIVLDQFNNPVQQALVGLFENQQEWGMLENPVQAWKATDANGSVVFINLKPENYFIFAQKGESDNLKNEIQTNQQLSENKLLRVIIHID